jgi:hypothetical protein
MKNHIGFAAWVSLTMNVAIGTLSFMVSYVALWDLARRSAVGVSWAWPLIVDGVILAATVGVIAASDKRYSWALLACGASASMAGNGVHAWMITGSWIAVGVSLVPPLALVAVTHLSVQLLRTVPAPASAAVQVLEVMSELPPREAALQMLAEGVPAKRIADEFGVSDRTVRRWREAALV